MLRWVPLCWMFAGLGCKSPTPPPVTEVPVTPPTDTAVPTADPPTPDPLLPLTLPATEPAETDHFATSDACATCHSSDPASTAMRDDLGNSVAPFDLWESSMMANAARDPLWRAVVSAEIAATPGAADVIGRRCMSCHAPMAYSQAILTGTAQPSLATLQDTNGPGNLARDGVSCSLCHQIEAEGLGQESTWKGNYNVSGNRVIYGPHTAPVADDMIAAGWTPEYSNHINNPNLCASCHMLITDALDPDGTPNGGSLVEQSPYLEMLNSINSGSTCQSCHFPSRTDDEGFIDTPIARNPDGSDNDQLTSRSIGRHTIVGGNTLIPQLFRDNPDILKPTASAAAFDATIASAQAQLRNRTAFLQVEGAARTGNTLNFNTQISLQTGHKFPTGIPIRRAWLRVSVTDAAGQQVFLSGDYDSLGRIQVDGALAPFEAAGGPLAPHHTTVSSSAQVQVYEAVMQDLAGAPTFLLLRGSGYLKDNRLLPEGWSVGNVNIDRIAPVGTSTDPDYENGGDTLAWSIDTTGHTAPFTVDARLLYQTLSNRFAEELWLADTPETNGLREMLESADRQPELVAATSQVID